MSVPGLSRRPRADGGFAWYWIASAVSRLAGEYPLRTRRILAATQEEAEATAWQYTAELRVWLSERAPTVSYSGTIASLIGCYRSNATSPYAAVRENTRRSYDHDLKILKAHVGAIRIDTLNREDFFRWHVKFAAPVETDGERRVRRAHGLMTMLRGLLSFGVSMRYAGCKGAKEVLDEMTFELPAPRHHAMTFAQAGTIIDKAVDLGVRSVALGQAIQFELGLRQIDVVGTWLGTSEKAGGLVHRGKQWTGGVTWADLTAARLAKRTSKTGQEGQWNPAEYPLLVKVMAAFGDAERMGPAIIDERQGRPYAPGEYSRRWREIATLAGIPVSLWNMDSRAGAITEADEAGADPEDVRKFATHTDRQTTQRYSRRSDNATSRVAKLRVEHRAKPTK